MGLRVFVGGLTHRVRERDIENFFRKCGRIKEVSLKKGFAFVEFDDHKDADDAVYELNGKELLGERVSVERARGTPRGRGRGGSRGYGAPRESNRDKYGPTRSEYRLIVENLSSRVSWQDLKDHMRQAGEVTYADAHKQRRNEGVVEFGSYSDVKNAIDKLDHSELNGRRIRLIEDKRRDSRRSRSSRSRSHSRSRSRSRSREAGSAARNSMDKLDDSELKSDRIRSRSSSSQRHGRSEFRHRSRSRSRSSRSRSRSNSKDRSKSGSAGRSTSRFHSKAKNRSRSSSMSKQGSKSKSQSPNI